MIVTNCNVWIYFRILIEIQFTKKKKKKQRLYMINKDVSNNE